MGKKRRQNFPLKKVSEKLRVPQHLAVNSCKVQLEEPYQGQFLILEYDSEISEDDEPRLRFIMMNSTSPIAEGAVRDWEEGNSTGNMKTDPGHRDN